MSLNNDEIFLLYYLLIKKELELLINPDNLSKTLGTDKHSLIKLIYGLINNKLINCKLTFDIETYKAYVNLSDKNFAGSNDDDFYINQFKNAKLLIGNIEKCNNNLALDKEIFELITKHTKITQGIKYISNICIILDSKKSKELLLKHVNNTFSKNLSGDLLKYEDQKSLLLSSIKNQINKTGTNTIYAEIFSLLGNQFINCNYLELIIKLELEGYFTVKDCTRNNFEKMNMLQNMSKFRHSLLFSNIDYGEITFSLNVNSNKFQDILATSFLNQNKLSIQQIKIKLYELIRYTTDCLTGDYDSEFWNLDFKIGIGDVDIKERRLETLNFLIHCYVNECFLPKKRDLIIATVFSNGNFEYDKGNNRIGYNKSILKHIQKVLTIEISNLKDNTKIMTPISKTDDDTLKIKSDKEGIFLIDQLEIDMNKGTLKNINNGKFVYIFKTVVYGLLEILLKNKGSSVSYQDISNYLNTNKYSIVKMLPKKILEYKYTLQDKLAKIKIPNELIDKLVDGKKGLKINL